MKASKVPLIALVMLSALAISASVDAARPRLTGEQQLAKAIAGRVAGEPVDCISLSASRDQRIIARTAIVYGSGSTIYVNRPTNARDLDRGDILVSNVVGNQYCRLDIIRTVDQATRAPTGFLSLRKFVPYRRAATR